MSKTVGSFIKNHRLRHKWSARELGLRAGVSSTEIHRIESGERRNPSPKTLTALSEVLEVPMEELYVLAGYLPKSGHVPAIEQAFPGLNKEAINAIQEVANILSEAKHLQHKSYEKIVEQVEMYVSFEESKTIKHRELVKKNSEGISEWITEKISESLRNQKGDASE